MTPSVCCELIILSLPLTIIVIANLSDSRVVTAHFTSPLLFASKPLAIVKKPRLQSGGSAGGFSCCCFHWCGVTELCIQDSVVVIIWKYKTDSLKNLPEESENEECVMYYACGCLFLHGQDCALDSNAKVKFLTFMSIFFLDTIE